MPLARKSFSENSCPRIFNFTWSLLLDKPLRGGFKLSTGIHSLVGCTLSMAQEYIVMEFSALDFIALEINALE